MCYISEVESFQEIDVSKSEQVEKLQSMLERNEKRVKELEVQLEELKKIEELKVLSSSHGSEVIKHWRDAEVQFSYMVPVSG